MTHSLTSSARRPLPDGYDGTATKKLLLVARTLVDKSIAGDVAALKELQDRIDGKPPPAAAGADKRPARITFQWKDSGS